MIVTVSIRKGSGCGFGRQERCCTSGEAVAEVFGGGGRDKTRIVEARAMRWQGSGGSQ